MSRSDPVDSLIPRHVVLDDEVVALLFVLSAPAGLVSRVSDYSGEPRAIRRWLRDWLKTRQSEWEAIDSIEPGTTASFMVVTVRRDSDNDDWGLGEFTYGEYPAAPDDWRSVPAGVLLAHALESLA